MITLDPIVAFTYTEVICYFLIYLFTCLTVVINIIAGCAILAQMQAHPTAKSFIYKLIENYEGLRIICADDIAIGSYATSLYSDFGEKFGNEDNEYDNIDLCDVSSLCYALFFCVSLKLLFMIYFLCKFSGALYALVSCCVYIFYYH